MAELDQAKLFTAMMQGDVCPACLGMGEFSSWSSAQPLKRNIFPCKRCGGKGFVPEGSGDD